MDTQANDGARYRNGMPSGKKPAPGRLARQVGAHVRALIEEAGRSQASIAADVGMSASQFSKCLRGEKAFDLDQIAAVADVLGTTAEAIVHAASRQ